MKKNFLLIILLAILGSIKVNAFTVAQIHVSVSNSQTGLAVPSHPVIITDSAGFNHTYYTNAYGQFNDSIYNAATTPVKYYIITYDCNNVMHYDTVTTFGWVYKSANFNICHVGADLGIIEIINPGDTSCYNGGVLYPWVKIKNFSSDTVSSFYLGYSINGQAPSLQLISCLLLPNDTQTFSLYSFLLPSNNFTICAFLVNNDNNSSNDTLCKTVVVSSPIIDAGVIQILNPLSALTGDTIYPQIKIKNFGTQTLTSVPVKYLIDGQLVGNAVCNLNITPNSTVIFTFPQYFICHPNYFCLMAYTELANDIVITNDTAQICLTPNPAIKDAGIIEIINPVDIVCSGNIIYPKVIIKNFGQTPLSSIPIAYQRGTQPIIYQTWSSSTPLDSGDTVSYTFTTPFTVPMGSIFSFSAFTNLANDGYSSNNKITKTIVIANTSIQSFNINGDDTIVAGQTGVVYQAGNYNYPYSQYVWTLPPGAFLDSVYNNNIIVHFANNAQSGNITCKIITPCGVTPTSVFPIYVFTTPPPPIISLGTNHIMYSGYSTGNQWYFENNAIQGANSQTYTATQTGHYYCKVSINGSTSAQSNTIYVGFTGLDEAYVKTDFEVYPNPANDKLFFRYTINKTDVVELKLMDIEGRCIKSILNDEQTAGEYKLETDINDLNKGMYFYQFRYGESVLSGKLIVVK